MIRLLGILLSVAILIGATASAVELLHDRELFVSPPDAIAEAFVREVMTKRYACAREYLLDPESISDAQLEDLQSRLGEGENPDAKIVSRDEQRASVDVRLKGTTFTVPLEWDKEWKVMTLPKVMVR